MSITTLESWGRSLIGSEINGKYALTKMVGIGGFGPIFVTAPTSHSEKKKGPPPNPFSPDVSSSPNSSGAWLELLHPDRVTELGNRANVLERAKRCETHEHLIPSEECDAVSEGRASDGSVYIITRQRGRSVYELREQYQFLSPDQSVALVKHVAHALCILHVQGLSHGLDPRNIFLDDQTWLLGPALLEGGPCEIEQDEQALKQLIEELARPELLAVQRKSIAEIYLALAGSRIGKAVMDLKIKSRDGLKCQVSSSKPVLGELRLVGMKRARRTPAGTVIVRSALKFLGEVQADDATVSLDSQDIEPLYVAPITLLDEAVTIGRELCISPVPDVGNLRAYLRGNNLVVCWEWPHSVDNARVVWNFDRVPDNPAAAVHRRDIIRSGNYGNGVEIYAPRQLPHVMVYSCKRNRYKQWVFSSGATLHSEVMIGSNVQCRQEKLPGGIHWVHLRADRELALPEIAVVAKDGSAPTEIDDGRRVATIKAGRMLQQNGEEPVVDFELPRPRKKWILRLFPAIKDDNNLIVFQYRD